MTAAVAVGLVAAVGLGGVAVGRAAAVAGTSAAAAAGRFEHSGTAAGYWGRIRGGTDTGGAGTGGTSATVPATRAATSTEEVGVVDINTVLDYGTGRAAGTGLVLTASGEILTNNHVIDGATAISVTDVTSGRTYTASVVGTDPTADVAVIQLGGASGLATAHLAGAAAEAGVAVGNAITAVGNAGGTGGTPTASPGTVTALDQSITAGDSTGVSSEQLSGVIEIAAAVEAGDSGGPLYDNGVVIGIDTAANSTSTAGFAIPITTATGIADQIVAGDQSSTIHLGNPAFLGVQLSGSGAATLGGVISGTPAATAGLAAGDTITAVDGTPVASAQALSTLLAAHRPGDRVTISWTDLAGTAHTATVTLAAGPAD